MRIEDPQPIITKNGINRDDTVSPSGRSADTPYSRYVEVQRRQSDQGQNSKNSGTDSPDGDESNIDPTMRAEFVQLVEEVAHLREELRRSERQVDYLTKLSDQDPVSALLNRRAFVRELKQAISIIREGEVHGVLTLLHVENLLDIHRTRGLDTGDAAVGHVAAQMQDYLPDSVILGRIEGATFGIIFVGSSFEEARNETAGLVRSLQSRPLMHGTTETELKVTSELHALVSGEDAEAAIAATDLAWRSASRQAAGTNSAIE